MTCTVCKGTGFVNLYQIPEVELDLIDDGDVIKDTLEWIDKNDNHEVQVCYCCGDGEDWYGKIGCHYHGEENEAVYDYNGGLCECH